MTMRINEIAAAIHADMCNDERNGYSWAERHGGEEVKVIEIDGRSYAYRLGDYDCSSSVIDAWNIALVGTPYDGALSGAVSTHNIRQVFLDSGLFTWEPMDFTADVGDLYLNELNHVAMCQSQAPDMLSEFSSNEFGGAYGGQRGDQTGWESHITGYYDYPWDGIVHYNGKADGTIDESEDDDMQAIDVWAYKNEDLNGSADAYALLTGASRNSAKAVAQIAALTEAVNVLAKSKGVDPKVVADILEKAVNERLSKIELSIKAS